MTTELQDRLQRARLRLGLTVAELARRLDCHVSTVETWLYDTRRDAPPLVVKYVESWPTPPPPEQPKQSEEWTAQERSEQVARAVECVRAGESIRGAARLLGINPKSVKRAIRHAGVASPYVAGNPYTPRGQRRRRFRL